MDHEERGSNYRNGYAVFDVVFDYFRDTFFLDLFWPSPPASGCDGGHSLSLSRASSAHILAFAARARIQLVQEASRATQLSRLATSVDT